MNASFHTNFDGTYIRKDICNENETEKGIYKGSHAFYHHTNLTNWECYAQKCAELISNFIQSLGGLVSKKTEQSGVLNFNINASVVHSHDRCKNGTNCTDNCPTIEHAGPCCLRKKQYMSSGSLLYGKKDDLICSESEETNLNLLQPAGLFPPSSTLELAFGNDLPPTTIAEKTVSPQSAVPEVQLSYTDDIGFHTIVPPQTDLEVNSFAPILPQSDFTEDEEDAMTLSNEPLLEKQDNKPTGNYQGDKPSLYENKSQNIKDWPNLSHEPEEDLDLTNLNQSISKSKILSSYDTHNPRTPQELRENFLNVFPQYNYPRKGTSENQTQKLENDLNENFASGSFKEISEFDLEAQETVPKFQHVLAFQKTPLSVQTKDSSHDPNFIESKKNLSKPLHSGIVEFSMKPSPVFYKPQRKFSLESKPLPPFNIPELTLSIESTPITSVPIADKSLSYVPSTTPQYNTTKILLNEDELVMKTNPASPEKSYQQTLEVEEVLPREVEEEENEAVPPSTQSSDIEEYNFYPDSLSVTTPAPTMTVSSKPYYGKEPEEKIQGDLKVEPEEEMQDFNQIETTPAPL